MTGSKGHVLLSFKDQTDKEQWPCFGSDISFPCTQLCFVVMSDILKALPRQAFIHLGVIVLRLGKIFVACRNDLDRILLCEIQCW